MLTVEEAISRVAAAASRIEARTERVAVAEAHGRFLAEDVAMDHDVPPFDRAMMDGYAVRDADAEVGRTLTVLQVIEAGQMPTRALGAREAARIMTGAPVPDGADRVLPFEWTTSSGERVTIDELPASAPFIAQQGSHLAAGETVLAAASSLSPAALGALATAGVSEVPVFARPQVAVLGTGSELVPVGERPGPGRIRNSNASALLGQIARAGALGVDLGIAADDEGVLEASIAKGLERADVLLLSGGVSKGDKDLVPAALAAQGVDCVFHRWRVQPGGPLWFGARDDKMVFALPGNPQATLVGFELLVIPALAAFRAQPVVARRTLRARWPAPGGAPAPRRRFRFCTLVSEADGRLVAEPLPWHGSGDSITPGRAEALAVLPEDEPAPRVVEVVPIAEGALVHGGAS